MRNLALFPRQLLAATLGMAIVLAGAVACRNPISASAPPKPVSWTVVWKPDFSGSARSGLNTRYWKYDTGTEIGNGQVETLSSSPENVYLDGHGDLDITATQKGDSWRSGRIQTTELFSPPAGGQLQITASIKQPDPKGPGYQPAFWLLAKGAWPAHGEVDIMEDVDSFSKVAGTLHCGSLVGRNGDGTWGPCHEHTGLSSGLQACTGCQVNYHTYSVVIDRRDPGSEQIRWYLDGQEFYSVSESQVGAAVWTEAVDHGFSIVLDIAIGGIYSDMNCGCSAPTTDTTAGGTLSVRSLEVLQGTTVGS